MDLEWEHRVRSQVFAWLAELSKANPDALPAKNLQQGIDVDGHRIGVMSSGLGIHKPRSLDAPISVMTTAPPAGQPPPYLDRWIDESRLSYAYQGEDPDLWTNRALRRAWEHRLPLVYLYGVSSGRYLAEFPVYVSGDHPGELRVDLVIAAAPGEPGDTAPRGVPAEIDGRSYAVRSAKTRLHQHGFRTRVLTAYDQRCSMCSLRHSPLLDAAHIVPDDQPDGLAITPNGLSLCKIHHAAYDARFLGVRPDLVVEVNEDLLDEVDGPMLQHGIQALHRQPLRVVPKKRVDRPNRDRLEWRYQQFLEGR